MKVICIRNINYGDEYRLTISKLYDVISEDNDRYLIKNDAIFESWYRKSYFKTLSEVRCVKINKLLDE
jgi:hypothetical protein